MKINGLVDRIGVPAAIVLTIFTILKLLILARYGALQANDTMGYQWVADGIAHDPRFWTSIPDWTTSALPIYAFRPIGYPLLLVLTRTWPVVILVQIAMSVGVAWLLARLVREATSSAPLAAFAALFFLGGETLLWDASVLSDTFYAALFNLVILTLLRAGYLNRQLSMRLLLLLGFVWGYSIWVRENGLYLTIIPLGLLMLSGSARPRLANGAIFVLPVLLMVGLYVGWNHVRTGETFVGITGAPNYMLPVFRIAKAGHVDPFADNSRLSIVVKQTATDYMYPDEVAVMEKLHNEDGLGPLGIEKLAQHKLIETITTHPVAYAGVVLENLNPYRLAGALFDPLATINDFYQLGVPPHLRIIPGTGLKSFRDMAKTGDYSRLALGLASLIAQLLSTALFLYAVVVTVLRRAKTHTAATPAAVLGARALAVVVVVLGSFALIHSEARHMMPVIPAFLIVTALALRRPHAT
jgi:hypothetical protein